MDHIWAFGAFALIMVAATILLCWSCYYIGEHAGFHRGYVAGKLNEQERTDIWIREAFSYKQHVPVRKYSEVTPNTRN